jgi:hypothetical protein
MIAGVYSPLRLSLGATDPVNNWALDLYVDRDRARRSRKNEIEASRGSTSGHGDILHVGASRTHRIRIVVCDARDSGIYTENNSCYKGRFLSLRRRSSHRGQPQQKRSEVLGRGLSHEVRPCSSGWMPAPLGFIDNTWGRSIQLKLIPSLELSAGQTGRSRAGVWCARQASVRLELRNGSGSSGAPWQWVPQGHPVPVR